jgi:hypothetical protein
MATPSVGKRLWRWLSLDLRLFVKGREASAKARLPTKAQDYTAKQKLELIDSPLLDAAKILNQLIKQRRPVGAIFHTTC